MANKPRVMDCEETRETWRSAGGGTSTESTVLYFEVGDFTRFEYENAAADFLADGNGYVGTNLRLYFGERRPGEYQPVTVTVEKEW